MNPYLEESAKNPLKYRVTLWLLVLWAFATYFNLDKSFHIDDTGHLEIARWIEQNPLHPMSGLVNWSGEYEAISKLNQPPLYFYLMAGWGHLFGYSEVAMHLLMSLFSLWALSAFYRLAALIHDDHAIYVTSFFALSPAFVVGQNTMIDVPLIAIWTEFYYTLLNPRYSDQKRFGIASALCSVALLVKYTSLVLLPALLLASVIPRKFKHLTWLIVPIGVIALWSIFNIYDYGGIHIFERSTRISKSLKLYAAFVIQWINILAAMMPFAIIIFIAELKNNSAQAKRVIWGVICAVTLMVPVMVIYSAVFDVTDLTFYLNLLVVLSISGAAILYICIRNLSFSISGFGDRITRYVLSYWIGSTFIFVIFLAPFMAPRHVLLVIPPVILVVYAKAAKIQNILKYYLIALASSLAITPVLAKADNWYADIYKNTAFEVVKRVPPGRQIWFVGHWGWQWYAKQAGMKHLSRNSELPRVGDFLVIPLNSVGYDMPDYLNLSEVKSIVIERQHWYQHFATIGMYCTPLLPWTYSSDPLETFKIYQINGGS